MLNEAGLIAAARIEAEWDGRTFDALGRADKDRYTDRLAAAITAYLSTVEKPENGWRSMDSAPKGDGKCDGPAILVHGGSIEFDASDNRFPSTEVERVNWSVSESCWIAGYYGGHDMFIRIIDPVGWQHLPTPPASATKGE